MPEETLFTQAEERAFRCMDLPAQQEALLKKYAKKNQKAQPGGLVLAGDSLTEFLPVTRLKLPEPFYNRGIRGIGSQFLLEHLDELVLALAPSRLLLLIGTNDLMVGMSPDELVAQIETTVARVREAQPACRIYLQSLYPRRTSEQWGPALTDEILAVNLYLRQLPETVYLDLHSLLSDSRQELRSAYTRDGVHLTMAGYRAVAAELEAALL